MHISLAADGVSLVPQLSVSCMGAMSAFHALLVEISYLTLSPARAECQDNSWALPIFTEAGERESHLRYKQCLRQLRKIPPPCIRLFLFEEGLETSSGSKLS